MLNEQMMNGLKGTKKYDMGKLEIEYDYDTDNEQLERADKLLKSDLFAAIDWFVEGEPLDVCSNLPFQPYSLLLK